MDSGVNGVQIGVRHEDLYSAPVDPSRADDHVGAGQLKRVPGNKWGRVDLQTQAASVGVDEGWQVVMIAPRICGTRDIRDRPTSSLEDLMGVHRKAWVDQHIKIRHRAIHEFGINSEGERGSLHQRYVNASGCKCAHGLNEAFLE